FLRLGARRPAGEHRVAERGAGLGDEGVGREVPGVELERALEAAPPALERVAGKSEHEVERESPESVRPREREGGGGPFGTVDPTQALELVGMEALNPHREAVDHGGGPGIE